MVKNLPIRVNITLDSPQFMMTSITKAPKIPFISLFIPQNLSFSLKNEIAVILLKIPVKKKLI